MHRAARPAVTRRRRSWTGPTDRPDAPWLVAVSTSATCSTCEDVWSKALVLASDEVAVQQVEAVADKDLHDRYRVEAVPIVAQ